MNKIIIIFMFTVAVYKTVANETEETQDDFRDFNENIYKKYVKMDKQIKGLAEQSVKNLLPYLLQARDNVNISASCSKNLFSLITGLRKLTNWSLSFIDATGKPQSGILVGNIQMLGEYDECVDTMVEKNGKVDFQGKYCLALIKPFLPKVKKIPRFYDRLDGLVNATRNATDLTKQLVARAHGFFEFSTRMGLCVPSGCSKQDISEMMKYTVGDYFNTSVSNCFKKGDIYFWTTKRTIIVSVFVLFAMVVVICTWIDNYSPKWKKDKIGMESSIWQYFSLTRNFPKLMNTKVSENTVTCLNGIRVLTIFWVMLGHEYFFLLLSFSANHTLTSYDKIYKSFFSQIVVNGFLSVDVFFFMSGFVNCYTRMLIKRDGKPQPGFLKIIFYRLWRIYPGYIITLMILYLLTKPQPFTYSYSQDFITGCDQSWWRNFIFINLFFHPTEMCLPQSWFVASDMLLFLISLFTVPVLISKPKRGIILHISLIVIVNLCSMSYWFLDDASPTTLDGSIIDRRIMFKNVIVYYLPFVHVGSYFIGILMGYVIATKKEIKISKIKKILGWLVASFFFLSMIFITLRWNSGVIGSKLENSLHGAWSRTIFVLGFSWLVFCCATGHAKLINYILSLKLWIPLSRLIYLLYLISPLVQGHENLHITFPKDIDHIRIIWNYFGNISISILLCFALVLLYESPLLALQKVFLGTKRTESKASMEKPQELSCVNGKENGNVVTIHL